MFSFDIGERYDVEEEVEEVQPESDVSDVDVEQPPNQDDEPAEEPIQEDPEERNDAN